jgi:hypothetical protein
MWVVKTQGKTFYVHHVECNVPWTTKETPLNSHTKGSIKIRNCVLTIDQQNSAVINRPTIGDRWRLGKTQVKPIRLLIGNQYGDTFAQLALRLGVEHGPLKEVVGSCGSKYHVTEIWQEQDITTLILALPANSLRLLAENERYYTDYDSDRSWIPEDEDDEDDQEV